MQKAVGKRGIGARRNLQMKSRRLRGWCFARIDYDERASAVARCASKYCITGGIVSAALLPISRIVSARGMSARGNGKPAIKPKRLDGRGCRGRHAETSVVIDLRSAQRHPRELSEQVRFFVGQAAAAEYTHRIRAKACLRTSNFKRNPVESFVPGGGAQRAGPSRRGCSGVVRRSGLSSNSVALQPFLTKTAAIHRKISCLYSEPAPGRRQVHPALQSAIRAVRSGCARRWLHTPPRFSAASSSNPARRRRRPATFCATRLSNRTTQ